jgi:hypothetical protein
MTASRQGLDGVGSAQVSPTVRRRGCRGLFDEDHVPDLKHQRKPNLNVIIVTAAQVRLHESRVEISLKDTLFLEPVWSQQAVCERAQLFP